jgi:hypothetical protein
MSSTEADIQGHRIWLLRLVFNFRFGGWLSGALIFLVLFGLFKIFVVPGAIGGYTTAFFCGVVAYIIPIYSHIVRRSLQAFDALQPLLEANPAQIGQWRRSLYHGSTTSAVLATIGGLSGGVAHVAILALTPEGSFGNPLESSSSAMAAVATVLIWLTMTTVISSVVTNARLFYQLGKDHLSINLLNTSELVPLAWVSVISTLALIGAQAMFGLLMLDPSTGLETLLPGFIAITIPMLPLGLLPIWSIHKRLQQAKAKELHAINMELARVSENTIPLQAQEKLAELNQLLAYRREIASVHAWPFDLGAASKLGLYLIIPPLTWVGAALIENLVENLL